MSLKLVYTGSDGNLYVVHAVPKEIVNETLKFYSDDGSERPMTDQEYYNHVMEKSIPAGAVKVREITETDLPTDRTYRSAWCDVTESKSIDLDMGKVKNLLLEKVRVQRNEVLSGSDALIVQGLESGKDLESVKAERKVLRDITDKIKKIKVTKDHLNDPVKLKELEDASDAALDSIDKIRGQW